MLRQAFVMWICSHLAAVAASELARIHEARQGPISPIISTQTGFPSGPGPMSIQTSSKTTMSPTSSSTTLHSSTSTSPSGTSSATPQPSSSPGNLTFTIHNMTTCTSALISWDYSGREAELLLSISSSGVEEYNTSSSRIKARQSTDNAPIQQQLVDTNTSTLSWTWSSVNLTQGWYEVQGLVLAAPSISNYSTPFFIANGTDVSCLTAASSPTTSPTPSASPSSVAPKTNVAAIAGGVVGGVIGVVLAIIAGVCLWSRKRKRPLVGGGQVTNRKWGSLKSTNSSIQPGESESSAAASHFHGRSESMARVLEDVGAATSAESDENVATVSEEKLVSPAPSTGISPFDALNTPIHYDRRSLSYYPVQLPVPIASEDSRSRTASLHTPNQSIEQQAQRIRSSMEVSIQRRSERLSMPTLPSGLSRLPRTPTHATPTEEYPLSPVMAAPVNRSISAGALSVTMRRASRKPVPQYDPSVLLEDANADSVSTFTGGAESSQSHGTGMGTGAFGTQTDLVHKASFGDGRPVHYLIPDMPPPQRE